MWVGDMIARTRAHLVAALITKWEGGKERLLQRKAEDPKPWARVFLLVIPYLEPGGLWGSPSPSVN